MPFTAGEHVRVRGSRWIVDDVTTFGDCAVISLAPAQGGEPRACRLLLPFDCPVRVNLQPRPRLEAPKTWMPRLLATMSALRTFGQLRAAAAASIDVLPFQLEPALALITGQASRFLLADEVGLGKTIQASLMLAELQQRGWCERALILTPAGLRRQWADELDHRFGIRAAILDSPALAELTGTLPLDVNPWTVEPVVITSIDFIKQPEVLQSLRPHLWDMLIVDEAHQASISSLRFEAVQMLAARARHVVLVTATPHGGDDAAYAALCTLGRLGADDPLLLFRRTRRAVDLGGRRRVRLLEVRTPLQTLAMHRQLAAYVQRVWAIGESRARRDLQLVALLLSKRAFSSAWALARSLERRLNGLSEDIGESQPPLPFDIDDDRSDEAVLPMPPAFEDAQEERRVLEDVLQMASAAATAEPKFSVIDRWLRRVREPAIVFTEYRDTLEHLERSLDADRRAVTLHGGKTAQERREAVACFTKGKADLLLATDAGAEGLNLHERCRIVINLELPWNPIRLEQRIGRVDRIGQTRTVHAVNLLASDTAEADVLARLAARLDRIHASEIAVAASILGRAEAPPPRHETVLQRHTIACDLSQYAAVESGRLQRARCHRGAFEETDEGVVPATVMRAPFRSPLLRSLDHHVIWFVVARMVNGAGRLVDERLIPIATAEPRQTFRSTHVRVLRDVINTRMADVIDAAVAIARGQNEELQHDCAAWTARALSREQWLRTNATGGDSAMIQAGLFDNRAVRARGQTVNARQVLADASLARTRLLDTLRAAAEPAVELAFVLLIRPC